MTASRRVWCNVGYGCSGKLLSIMAETLLVFTLIGTLASKSHECSHITEEARQTIRLVSGGTVLLLSNLAATMLAFVYTQHSGISNSSKVQQDVLIRVTKFTCAVIFPFLLVFLLLLAFPDDFCLTDDVHVALAGSAATVTAQAVFELAILPSRTPRTWIRPRSLGSASILPRHVKTSPISDHEVFRGAQVRSTVWNLQLVVFWGFSVSSFLGAVLDFRIRGCFMALTCFCVCIDVCCRAFSFCKANQEEHPRASTVSGQSSSISEICLHKWLPGVFYSYTRIRSNVGPSVSDAFRKMSFILTPSYVAGILSLVAVSINTLGCSYKLLTEPVLQAFPLGTLYLDPEQSTHVLQCGVHEWWHVTHPASRSLSFLALGVSCTMICFACSIVWNQVFMVSTMTDLKASKARSQAMLRWLSHECRSPAAAATLALEAVIDELCPKMEAMATGSMSLSSSDTGASFAAAMQEGKRMLHMAQVPMQSLGATLDNMLNFMQNEAGVRRLSDAVGVLHLHSALEAAWAQSIMAPNVDRFQKQLQCSVDIFGATFDCKEAGGQIGFPSCSDICNQLQLQSNVPAATVTQVLTNFLSNGIKYGGQDKEATTLNISLSIVRGQDRFVHGRFASQNASSTFAEVGWLQTMRCGPDTAAHAASLDMEEAMMIISVSDRGQGLSSSEQETLFQPFSRLRRGSHNKGHGLGLWLMKQLVNQQGGFIHVRSPGIGRGSTFSLAFPVIVEMQDDGGRASQESTLAHASSLTCEAQSTNLKGTKVLLVDDSLVVRKMISRVLVRSGCLVTECEDGREALDHVQIAKDSLSQFDIVVTDMTMPHMSGDELCLQICRLYNLSQDSCQRPLLIGVTGNALEADVKLFRKSGADYVLIKPVRGAELLRAMRTISRAELPDPGGAAFLSGQSQNVEEGKENLALNPPNKT